jgi:hypothetical protein
MDSVREWDFYGVSMEIGQAFKINHLQPLYCAFLIKNTVEGIRLCKGSKYLYTSKWKGLQYVTSLQHGIIQYMQSWRAIPQVGISGLLQVCTVPSYVGAKYAWKG